MKYLASFFLSLLTILAFTSCEKETVLSVDQTSITIPDTGGYPTVSLTANKPWTASSNQSWCKVSPSGGEGASSSRITITCDPNTTYDARTASVTFTCAEKTVSVSVSQAINNGLLVSQTEYNITNAAQQLEIPVQANVKFSVEVDNGCNDWVKYNTTKGLSNSTVVLDIAKNEAYDGREGKVTIKQSDGNLSTTIVIKQGQLDGLFLTTSEYNLSNEKHTLTVEVKSNIEFEVKPEADWIKYVETKGLKTNQIILDIAENDTYDVREGKVTVKQKNGDLTGTITVKQEGRYFIIEYTTTDGKPIIPNSVEGLESIKLEIINNTYANGTGRLFLRDTVKVLPLRAFARCITLETIQIPKGILAIGKYTFMECSHLKTIELPESLTAIGYGAFATCTSLNTIELPQTVSVIDKGAFMSCESLESFRFPEGIKEISDGVFWGCSGLKSIYIPTTVSMIGDQAFQICSSLESIEIPSSVTSIGQLAFSDCAALRFIEIPGSVKEIGANAFTPYVKGTNLEEVVLNDGVESFSLNSGVFENCTQLKSITIPGSIRELGTCTFKGCSSLKHVTIQDGVTRIGIRVFEDCTSLTDITIPDSVIEIRAAFVGCSSLKSIILPKCLELLEASFMKCSNLEAIEIPRAVSVLGGNTFDGCEQLKRVTLPSTINRIENATFKGCKSLVDIQLPDSITCIGWSAFEGCSSLNNITIPSKVDTIWSYAFWGCKNLTKVTLLPVSPPALCDSGLMVFSTIGDFYVPKGSLDAYMSDKQWGTYIGVFKELEDI